MALWSAVLPGISPTKVKNMTLSSMCYRKCDKGYVFQLPLAQVPYNGDYAMPLSNKLDLTVGATLTFAFNRNGGQAAITERLQGVASKYQPRVTGDSSFNQKLTWSTALIIGFDLPISKFKSITRSRLGAYDQLSTMGKLVTEIETDIRTHLATIDSSIELVHLEFHQIAFPKSVNEKNKQEHNLQAQERIQKQHLCLVHVNGPKGFQPNLLFVVISIFFGYTREEYHGRNKFLDISTLLFIT